MEETHMTTAKLIINGKEFEIQLTEEQAKFLKARNYIKLNYMEIV